MAKWPVKCLWANSRCDRPGVWAWIHQAGGHLHVASRARISRARPQLPYPGLTQKTGTISSGERGEAQGGRGEGLQMFPPAWRGASDLGWGPHSGEHSSTGRSPAEGLEVLEGVHATPLQAPVARTHIPSGSSLQTTRQHRSRSHCSGFSETLKATAAH